MIERLAILKAELEAKQTKFFTDRAEQVKSWIEDLKDGQEIKKEAAIKEFERMVGL